MASESAVASRRTAPQLPPILTGLNESLLGPTTLTLRNPEKLDPKPPGRSIYPVPTPAPSPAFFGAATPPPPPPQRQPAQSVSKIPIEPKPLAEPKEDERLSALPLPPQAAKALRPKRSLFSLFSRSSSETTHKSLDPSLESKVGDDDSREGRSANTSMSLSGKLSIKRRSMSHSRSNSSNKPKLQDLQTDEEGKSVKRPVTSGSPAKSKKESTTMPSFDLTLPELPDPQVHITKERRKPSPFEFTQPFSTKKSQISRGEMDRYRDMWKPPPLFQAYPQATKYSTVQGSPSSSEEIQSRSMLQSLKSKDEHRPGTDYGSLARPKSRRKSGNSSQEALPVTKHMDRSHIYVLVTSGYLLQYSADGQSDRFPEKILKLSANSAAFASDLIPGKHWVLQVEAEMLNDTPAASTEQKSLLQRLRHSSSNLTVSTLLMVFDSPEDMDGWMSTIRREIDLLAGRKSRQPSETRETDGNTSEELSPIERYRSITRPSLLPLRRTSENNSQTLLSGPRSPVKPAPLSPSTTNSEWMSNSTGPGTTISELSSARSSRQATESKPTHLSKGSSITSVGDTRIADDSLDSANQGRTSIRAPQVSVETSLLSSSPDSAHPHVDMASSVQGNGVQSPEHQYYNSRNMTMASRDSEDDATLEFTKDDSDFYKDFLDPTSDDEELVPGESLLPLQSPSEALTAFPPPPRASRRLSRMPLSNSSSFSPTAMESISESKPYFSRRLPDPPPIEEYQPSSQPAYNSSSSPNSTSRPTMRSSMRMSPAQIRASAVANWSQRTSPAPSGASSRRTSAFFPSPSDSHASTLDALTGQIPVVASPTTSPPDIPSRRTSVIHSSKTPLPFRASMQFQQPPAPGLTPDQSTDSPPSSSSPNPLRRPTSLRVRNDPAPFVTTVRSAPASRTPSMMAENPSKRSSTAVPIVRPPMRNSASRRQSALLMRDPPRPPPTMPLPTLPPDAPLPPAPQLRSS